ncbi:copper resistance protein B [Acinetobacter johnsonii]|uniref:copper resistance protein B n=1 Tax=Acinetobacter johnsonii TaxID=40214 RepID=UPI003AF4A430
MRTINLFSKSIVSSSLVLMSATAMAHEVHHMPAEANANMSMTTESVMSQYAQQMNHDSKAHTHDHRKEHGAQIYAVTTVDNKWLLNEDGDGDLKSEFETRIGTDENKLFIKVHADKQEAHKAEYDAKVLYSRMISDFWDVQAGARYRAERVEHEQQGWDTEEKVDGVLGLHGLAPYFFETDAYVYAGADNYAAFSLETERDLLLTQKLIFKPYLDMNIIFSDDSKYAKKSGLSSAAVGLETRYEISKKVMPYVDIAYEYSKGNEATAWQTESDEEKGWQYGMGLRFKF